MSQGKVKAAVMKAIDNRIALLDPPVEVAWPNKKFKTPAGSWIRVSYMPSQDSTETLGEGGEQELLGIIQLDVNILTDIGEKTQNLILGQLEAYFVPGKRFTYKSQTVNFVSCNRSSGRIIDSFFRVSLSVSFYARYFRATP